MKETCQTTMDFETGAPAVDAAELDRLIYWLESMDGWATSEAILRWMGLPVTDGHRRRLRALAEASDGRIASAPGAPGYILTKKLRPEDLHLIEGLRTQSDRMRARYISIMNQWHRRQVP